MNKQCEHKTVVGLGYGSVVGSRLPVSGNRELPTVNCQPETVNQQPISVWWWRCLDCHIYIWHQRGNLHRGLLAGHFEVQAPEIVSEE